MLLILTHSTPLKREFPHICKSESKFLNFAVAFTSYKLAFAFASEQNIANVPSNGGEGRSFDGQAPVRLLY